MLNLHSSETDVVGEEIKEIYKWKSTLVFLCVQLMQVWVCKCVEPLLI